MKKASEDAFFYKLVVVSTKTPSDDNKEDRDEEDCQQRRGQHSPHYARTDRILRAATRSVADNQRHNPQNKRQRCHQDWTKTHARRLQSGFYQPFTLFIHQVFGKFDDQDGVF